MTTEYTEKLFTSAFMNVNHQNNLQQLKNEFLFLSFFKTI